METSGMDVNVKDLLLPLGSAAAIAAIKHVWLWFRELEFDVRVKRRRP
jgi:hypothetical protein